MSETQEWKDRLIMSEPRKSDELMAIFHPSNPKVHPVGQTQALKGALKTLGWMGRPKVNLRSSEEWGDKQDVPVVIDGHDRIKAANEEGLEELMVDFYDLTPNEEHLFLLTYDPIGMMALHDRSLVEEHLNLVNTDDENLQRMLAGLAEELSIIPPEGWEPNIGGSYEDGEYKDNAEEEQRASLSERFLVPPFSIVDARKGEWYSRKKAWVRLGIKSDESRAGMKTMGSLSGTTPRYYQMKEEMEASVGRKLTNVEFEEKFLPQMLPKDSLIKTTTDGGILSIFDPVLAEVVYTWFTKAGHTVLDPFAGGSVRGVVAGYLGRPYTGVDLREEQVASNIKQANAIFGKGEFIPHWIAGNSLNAIPNEEYDFVFSCPPYYDLEVYSDDPEDLSNKDDYETFLAEYRQIIVQSIHRLKENRFACFVVGDVRDQKTGYYRNFVSDTIAAFRDAGAELYNEIILVTNVGSLAIRAGRQFQLARKVGKSHQNILVFVKGDGKEAARECGFVEVVEVDFGAEDEEE